MEIAANINKRHAFCAVLTAGRTNDATKGFNRRTVKKRSHLNLDWRAVMEDRGNSIVMGALLHGRISDLATSVMGGKLSAKLVSYSLQMQARQDSGEFGCERVMIRIPSDSSLKVVKSTWRARKPKLYKKS
eukprot:2452901-Pleurochrysis_carterae.AAC.1